MTPEPELNKLDCWSKMLPHFQGKHQKLISYLKTFLNLKWQSKKVIVVVFNGYTIFHSQFIVLNLKLPSKAALLPGKMQKCRVKILVRLQYSID